MTQEQLIINIRNTAADVLRHIEAAQAAAARQAQEWTKLGGETFLTDFDWNTVDVTAAQITSAISSMSTALPDILGNHGTNLYTVKG